MSIFFWSNEAPKKIEEIIKVDVVGLPTLTLKELEDLKKDFSSDLIKDDLPEKTVQESVTKIKEEVPQNDTLNNEKNSAAMDLIKNLSRKAGVKNTTGGKKKKKLAGRKIPSKKLKNLLLEGNKLSKGTSVKGRYQSDVAEFDVYVLNLPNLIRPFWKLPSFLREQDLMARVIIYINSQGEVVHHRFVDKSGNDEFDSRAIKAIEDSKPFPIPDPEIRDRLLSEGVILGFPL